MLTSRPLASNPLAATGGIANKIAIGATEANDRIRLNLGSQFGLEIVASEPKDTASASMKTGRVISSTMSEAKDTAAFVIGNKVLMRLAASEANDVISASLLLSDRFSIWASEAADVSAINVIHKTNVSLSASEPADRLTANIGLGVSLRVSATEARDRAFVNFTRSRLMSIAASESADRAAMLVATPSRMFLSASETPDRASLTVFKSPGVNIFTTERPDVVLFRMNNENVSLKATELPDVAAFRFTQQVQVGCVAKETPDGSEIYIAPRWWEIDGTPCCTRWTEPSRADSQYVHLGELVMHMTEAPDIMVSSSQVSGAYILLDRQAHTTPYALGVTPDDYILVESGNGYIEGEF